jgi:hypothetical protein
MVCATVLLHVGKKNAQDSAESGVYQGRSASSNNTMNIRYLLLILGACTSFVAAQQQGSTTHLGQPPSKAAEPEPELTRFNLHFVGGHPRELVTAIEKATGKPLNAIIPEEHANVMLPPLKMNNVTVPQLFTAVHMASAKRIAYITGASYRGTAGSPQQSYQITYYAFETPGKVTDDSIWYFRVEEPPGPPLNDPKAIRFYRLTPYLEGGLTVDDITTAIQAGWRMLGEKEAPEISFHKDTQLLIAVGEPGKLETIDAALKALEPGNAAAGANRTDPARQPAARPAASHNE